MYWNLRALFCKCANGRMLAGVKRLVTTDWLSSSGNDLLRIILVGLISL